MSLGNHLKEQIKNPHSVCCCSTFHDIKNVSVEDICHDVNIYIKQTNTCGIQAQVIWGNIISLP